MRILLAAFVGLAMTSAALANQTEGKIKKIDVNKQTVTLDDGKVYKVPGEFDVSSLAVGDDLIIDYDVVQGENQITDMTTGD